jgi:two-component system, sporulation sensor kinase E
VRKYLQRALGRIDRMDRAQFRSLLQDAAAESELLEMVMESMSDGVVVTDRSDRILLVNKSAQRMLPFVAGELGERVLWETIEDREIAAFFRRSLAGLDRVVDREFTLTEGFVRTLALTVMPLVRQGSIQGNVIHIEDVTEKRAKEARLRRAESLAALTTLTAGVAHEIKNPLASIGIHIELIRKAIGGRQTVSAAKVSENLEVIKEEVERLNRIVVDFLFAVRPMNTELVLDDPNRLVRELLEFMRFELEQAGVQVELQLQEPSPQIRLDEKYFKQALLNIVKNAIAAMPQGGRLRVETVRKGNTLQLKVSDTGVGIPEEILDKIFEPYFTTREFGSGLGLTLVYKIVKEHLGDIAVSSKPGEGTTFTLSFPIAQKEKRLIAYQEDAR